MKSLNIKSSLLVIPATMLIISLVLGSVDFSLAAMFTTLLSSAVGVLLGVCFLAGCYARWLG